MLLARRKYRLSYLASITAFATLFNLVFAPLFFSFESNVIPKASAAAETISCNAGSSRTLTVGTYTDSDGSQFTTGADLTLNKGTGSDCTFTINGSISLASFTVQTGVTVTHGTNTTVQTNTLSITTTGNIDIQSGASINVDGKGYTGGASGGSNGNGTGGGTGLASSGAGGGGHGGNGGNGNAVIGGAGYCDVSSPATIGSGGGSGASTAGGTGAGLIILSASSGTITIDGTISAVGSNAVAGKSGGGAGGGVKIVADTIAGTPTSFTIAGGNSGGTSSDGGGGGGCALLSYVTSNSISPTSTYFAMGGGTGNGNRGGAGVVYVKKSGTNGDLYSKNSGSGSTGSQQGVTSLVADSLTVVSSSMYVIPTGKTLDLRNASPFSSGDGTGGLQVNNGGIFTPTTTGNFTVASSTLLVYQGGFITASTSVSLVIDYGATLSEGNFASTSAALTFSTITVQNGGNITHLSNTTTQNNILNLGATTMTVNSGGSINVSAKGYSGGYAGGDPGYGPGPGGGTGCCQAGGGGHGGAGGSGNAGAGGAAYSSSTDPGTIGSGGGGAAGVTGGIGAGLIILNISGTLTINGSVSATGTAPGGNAGGGAGGAVKITASTIAGTPTSFTVAGGNTGGGGGGGGSVALFYSAATSITSGMVTVSGGSGNASGSAGTFYSAEVNSTPTAPSTLYSSATSAQSGAANPTLLATTTPAFSAVYNDPNASDTTTKAHIQVSTDSSFATITHLDSGSSGNTITSCTQGNRCQDINYGNFGTTPILSLALGDDANENSQTVYYWRIRYFDAANVTGAYSTDTATFTLLDKPNAPSSLSAGTITASTATLSWTDNSSIETGYKLEASLDGGVTFGSSTTTAASATSLATSSLSVDTRYVYRVAGTNSVGTSSYATSSAFYTLANAAGTPSAAAASATSLNVTIDVNSNPTSTKYSLYNSTSGNYVAADGSSTASPVYQTTSTWGSSFAATGLTPNTAYQFVAVARNGDNTNTATSTASTAVYTLANVPSSLVLQTTATTGQLLATWNANSNAAGTTYYIEETSNSSINSGFTTETSHTFSGLTPGQTYTFRVKARNGAAIDTAYSSSVSGNVPSTGGGAAPATPAPAPPAPPLPFGDVPEDVPIEDFAPTGLIKVISATGGTVDVLQQADLSSPYQVSKVSSVVTVESSDQSLDLTSPFTLDFSFSLDKHPLDSTLSSERKLFAKPGAYTMGYSGTGQALVGLCFTLSNGSKVCDHAIERPPHFIAIKKQYDYHVTWTGSVMDFYDGTEKVDTASVGSIPTSENPLTVGGIRKEYQPGKFSTAFYPVTMHTLKMTSEPLLIYTNTPSIKLKIDSGYAPEFALKESDEGPSTDFGGSSFQPTASVVNWTLQGKDGKKCVNARFNSQLKKYKYDTFTCVILDTTKPSAEFSFDPGLTDAKGIVLASPRIFGVSDNNAVVTLSLTLQQVASSTLQSAPEILFPASGVLHLAGDNKTTTVNLKANKDGTWAYTVGDTFVPGLYTASVQTKDLAGNVSVPMTKDITIKVQAAEPKPVEPEIPEVPVEPVEDPLEEPATPLPEKPKNPKAPISPKGQPINPNDPNLGKNNDSASNVVALGNNGGNGDTAPATPQSEPSIPEQLISALTTAVGSVTNLANSVRQFLNNPTIQAANLRVAVPLFAVAGILNAAVGFQLPQIFNLLRYLFGQPTMLWRRRKQKSWGVVYNSFTKLPVDLATIRLVDEATGRVISSQVTDFHGRYFMAVDQGHYRLEVIKPGFVGFSSHLKEKDEDTKYVNLYHGEAFYPPRNQFDINYNIPLDPVVEQKPTSRILRDHAVEKIQFGLSLTGMAASLMSFVVTPRLMTAGFVVLHVGLFTLFYKLAHRKLPSAWGTIRSFADKTPLGRVVVRVFDSAYNKLVNTAVSDNHGRYAVLVGPSVYFVTYEKAGFSSKQSPTLDYSSGKTGGIGGLISRDEMLEEAK